MEEKRLHKISKIEEVKDQLWWMRCAQALDLSLIMCLSDSPFPLPTALASRLIQREPVKASTAEAPRTKRFPYRLSLGIHRGLHPTHEVQ